MKQCTQGRATRKVEFQSQPVAGPMCRIGRHMRESECKVRTGGLEWGEELWCEHLGANEANDESDGALPQNPQITANIGRLSAKRHE